MQLTNPIMTEISGKGAGKALLAGSLVIFLAGCAITPEAIPPEQVSATATHDMRKLEQQQAAIKYPITLEHAIARAVQFNRDKRMKSFESALAQGQLELVSREMLPELTASAGYTRRNNYAASASTTFENGKPTPLNAPSYSVSQGREQKTKSTVFTWDLLDFGLSYVRARQQADRYLITRERERKSLHNIVQEVRAAYWRAVSSERLLRRIEPLMDKVTRALSHSQEIETKQLRSPVDSLYYQRELLDILRSLQDVRQDLINARVQLAALMDLKPGTAYTLADVDNPSFKVPEMTMKLEKIEENALRSRPELLETYYQQRISRQDTYAAFLKMLPGFSLTAGAYENDNKYLLNQDWTSIGAQVSWNLLQAFNVPLEKKLAETRAALAEQQRLATSMAVLTQVHLARQQFEQSRKSYRLADRYLAVVGRIREQIENKVALDQASDGELIRESLNMILAELKRDASFAELQNSYGRIFASMGMDLLPETYAEVSVDELSMTIALRFQQWQQGLFELESTLPAAGQPVMKDIDQQDISRQLYPDADTYIDQEPSKVSRKHSNAPQVKHIYARKQRQH